MGALNSICHNEAKTRIKPRGDKITGSVCNPTLYLAVGKEPGSKYDKAVKLDMEILVIFNRVQVAYNFRI